MTDDNTSTDLVRLNKAIAASGRCSRRKADDLIIKGKVRINDKVITTPGVKVDPSHDVIWVDGRELSRPGTDEKPLYILMNKPPKIITTASDPQGRKTVLSLLPEKLKKKRPFPVGRLDFMSEGLLLLTTDGELTYRLTHPKWHLAKTYQVLVRGVVNKEKLAVMRRGMLLSDGTKLAPVKAKVVEKKGTGPSVLLELVLFQGINRQIRRMCRDLELKIVYLRRIALGPAVLGGLKPGEWRILSDKESKELRKAVHLECQ